MGFTSYDAEECNIYWSSSTNSCQNPVDSPTLLSCRESNSEIWQHHCRKMRIWRNRGSVLNAGWRGSLSSSQFIKPLPSPVKCLEAGHWNIKGGFLTPLCVIGSLFQSFTVLIVTYLLPPKLIKYIFAPVCRYAKIFFGFSRATQPPDLTALTSLETTYVFLPDSLAIHWPHFLVIHLMELRNSKSQ